MFLNATKRDKNLPPFASKGEYKMTLTVPLAIMNSFPSANKETETKIFSILWKISLPSGGIRGHKNE